MNPLVVNANAHRPLGLWTKMTDTLKRLHDCVINPISGNYSGYCSISRLSKGLHIDIGQSNRAHFILDPKGELIEKRMSTLICRLKWAEKAPIDPLWMRDNVNQTIEFPYPQVCSQIVDI